MCRAISKIMLVIVNTAFAIFSLIILAIGIWVAAGRSKEISKMEQAPEDSELKALANKMHLMTAAIVIIVVSVFCLLLTVSGCVGAMKENTCLLTFYSIVMAVLLLVQLAALGLAVAFKGRFQDDLTNEFVKVDQTLFMPYNQLSNNSAKQSQSDIISHIMNSIHVSLRCCGVNNYTDITVNSNWSRANPSFYNQPMVIPASCCKLTDRGVEQLANTDDWKDFKNYLINGSHCPTKMTDFNNEACLPKILYTMVTHATAIIVGVALYVVFNVVCIVMAVCLVRKYKSSQQHSL